MITVRDKSLVDQKRNGWQARSPFCITNCHILGCDLGAVSIVNSPYLHPMTAQITGSTITNCQIKSATIHGCICDSVDIVDSRCLEYAHAYGTVFRHCRIIGNIGTLLITDTVNVTSTGVGIANDEHAQWMSSFYKSVDWAIDVRQALGTDIDLRGIPADLVLRDPETQIIVRRQNVLGGKWRNIDLRGTWWAAALEAFESEGREDEVLVAPKLASEFPALIRAIEQLRGAGIADPD